MTVRFVARLERKSCMNQVSWKNASGSITVVTALLLAVGALAMAGCNTWKGAGKDVERTGEVMQGD